MKQFIKTAAIILIFSALSHIASSENTKKFPLLEGEKWWGAMTALGPKAPFGPIQRVPLSTQSYNNQNVPLLVSNMGRYVVAKEPFDFEIDGENLTIFSVSDTINLRRAGKTLRNGYMAAARTFVMPNAKIPPVIFFEKPQYNTWIELNFNQNQEDVLSYARNILANGLPAGILMIDDTWQRYFGNYDFKSERFADPKAMISQLKSMGFSVMLWVSPFISPDSQEFRDLSKRGLLVKRRGSNEPAIVQWWNGYSAVYDLTNPAAFEYIYGKLKENQAKYGVDGFKLDGGDLNFYNPATQTYHDTTAVPATHTQLWAELASRFPYNELRACWAMQGYPLVQRLGDKDYSWGALKTLVPEMINAGLMGYPYTCPDMIGGGQIGSFADVANQKFDQSLIVRSAQLHAMMPMMQFSVAPWRILDTAHMQMVKKAVQLHQQITPYIIELVQQAAKTGEPIIRSMEYNYPGKGFLECNDQYMIGERYVVAPITSADGKRMVSLPAGRWTDDQDKVFRGPLLIEVTAPLDRIPYYKSAK